jgi:hypothetical protein
MCTGFDAHQVLAMTVRLPDAKYPEDAQRTAFFDQLLKKIDALPGVESSSVVNSAPIEGWQGATLVYIEGRPATNFAETPLANQRVASADYCARCAFRYGRADLWISTTSKAQRAWWPSAPAWRAGIFRAKIRWEDASRSTGRQISG